MEELFNNNREWAEKIKEEDPHFFEKLSKQQAPGYLWIGCSDSRVPANEIVGLLPGELFVHRNVANLVVHTDLNCLSVIQFAVDFLKVKHIIVCGHYGCGGVRAAAARQSLGLIDNWLRHIHDVQQLHNAYPGGGNFDRFVDMLCEINVLEQALNVSKTTIVQDAWARGQDLSLHSWIYGVNNGLLKDLGLSSSGAASVEAEYQRAVARVKETASRR